MAWGETPEVRAGVALRPWLSGSLCQPWPSQPLAFVSCGGLFGVEPRVKSIAGLDFLLEVPAASNK